MVQARLRHGADRWDTPSLFYDTKYVGEPHRVSDAAYQSAPPLMMRLLPPKSTNLLGGRSAHQ